MANKMTPTWRLRKFKPKESTYIAKSHRSYARIQGKFVPIGYFIEWSDGSEVVILDSQLND